MPRDLISLIVPVYNVRDYICDFLDSLTAQGTTLRILDIIFVDDGSTDGSCQIIREWQSRTSAHTRLVTKLNGGLSSARNAGLQVAIGKWVTFCDPDDVLDADYFASILRFLRSSRSRSAALVATNILLLNDQTGQVTNRHPLRFKFTEGERVVDLNLMPRFIQLSAATSLYRRTIIEQYNIRFDERIRPNFEDAHFTTRYLLASKAPRVGLLPDAIYHYRRRQDSSSLVQSSWASEEKYTIVPQHGYLGLLEEVYSKLGVVPVWVQNLILYDLFFYFREDRAVHAASVSVPSDAKQRFHILLTRIAQYLDHVVIDGFDVIRTPVELRKAMLIGAKGLETRPDEIVVDAVDNSKELARISYYYFGCLPTETFWSRTREVSAAHQKIRSIEVLDRVMMYERIVWLPFDGAITAELDGHQARVRAHRTSGTEYSLTIRDIRREFPVRRPQPPQPSLRARHPLASALQSIRSLPPAAARMAKGLTGAMDALTRPQALTHRSRERYTDSWLLMDRDIQARDNAEHLYRYLRANRPDINIWFVLSRSSPDWDRLAAEGFRLIAHGSSGHTIALLHCRYLISSQVDDYVVNPLDRSRFGRGNWKFIFLQHGVTHNDLSRWLNFKPIRLMITASSNELESIVGDHTPYSLTTKEVVLTGLARHDRLRELQGRHDENSIKRVLIMPTWRRYLLGDTVNRGNERILMHDFWTSDYAIAWSKVLASERLRKAAHQVGWEIAFMPHPNMQGYLSSFQVPKHVRLCSYRDDDPQELISTAAVLVTDYSSVAFDAAYIECPVVYFQFDKEDFFSGKHAVRRSSWSYSQHGFGPVADNADSVVAAVETVAERKGTAQDIFVHRMRYTFPFRDGRCCERIVTAIEGLD